MTLDEALTSLRIHLERERKKKFLAWGLFLFSVVCFLFSLFCFLLPLAFAALLALLGATGIFFFARKRQVFMTFSTRELYSRLDSLLELEERGISLWGLQEQDSQRSDLSEAQSEYLEKQLEAILIKVDELELVHEPFPVWMNRAFIFFPLVWILAGYLLFSHLKGTPYTGDVSRSREMAQKLLDEELFLPTDVQEELRDLIDTLEDEDVTEEEIQEALRAAEDAVKEAQERFSEQQRGEALEEPHEKEVEIPQPKVTPTPEESQNKDSKDEKESQQEEKKGDSGKKQDSQDAKEDQGGKSEGEKGEGKGASSQGQGKGKEKEQKGNDGSGQGKDAQNKEGKGEKEGSQSGAQNEESKSGEKEQQGQSSENSKNEQQQQPGDGEPNEKQSGEQQGSQENKEKNALDKAQEALAEMKQDLAEGEKGDKGQGQKGEQPQEGKDPTKEGADPNKEGEQQSPEAPPKGKNPGQNNDLKDKQNPKQGADSDQPPTSSSPVKPGEKNPNQQKQGKGEGLGENKGFEEKFIEGKDEKFDTQYTGNEREVVKNTAETQAKTGLAQVELVRPEPSTDSSEQGIPLEYRDLIE